MRYLIGLLVILFDLLDNFTTFVCLTTAPTSSHEILAEANPIARWLFDSIGLVEGLALSTVVTLAAVVFLLFTKRLHPHTRLLLLGVLAILPLFAALNNLQVMHRAGIWL